MNKQLKYSPEVQERKTRLVFSSESEHPSRWSAIQSVASKIGCMPDSLRIWVNRVEANNGTKSGVSSDQLARLKELERENR